MVGKARPRGHAWWPGCMVVALCLGGQASAGPNDLASPPGRVRAADAKAADLLRAGSERSATFRHLTELIEQTDLVVYVETRQLFRPSQLQFVCATPGARYLMVSVRVPGLDNDLLPWLAHELWHAVEIARAPEVRDGAALVSLYERIGRSSRADGVVQLETREAQETQNAVLDELRRPVRPGLGASGSGHRPWPAE